MSRLLLPLSLVLFVPSLAAQGVLHVVDDGGGPGADFTSLGAAVSAAAPGDVLLVREGTYGLGTSVEKELVLVAEPGAEVSLTTRLLLRHTDAGSPIAVRGFSVSSSIGPTLDIDAALGAVLLEDCRFEALGGPFGPSLGAEIGGSDAVHAARCVVRASAGGEGLVAEGSRVALYGSSVHGGDAGSAGAGGGAGAVLRDGSELLASTSAVTGGDGGDGGPLLCQGGPGGPGLAVESAGAPSAARLLETSLQGGAGGAAGGACLPGAPGSDVAVEKPSSVVTLAGTARTSELDSLVVEGGALDARFAGAEGDFAFLFWSLGAAPGPFVPGANGVVFLEAPISPISAGVLPASGEATLEVGVPDLGLGELALPVFGHGVFVSAAGEIVLGSPTAAVIAGASALP